MKIVRNILVICTLVTASLVLDVGTAQAANPYTPQGVCGSGFKVIDGPGNIISKANGQVAAKVYLLWNSSTSQNCAVTIKVQEVGRATWTGVNLHVQDTGASPSDEGAFKYYAGPVKARAPGSCVAWGGDFSHWSTRISVYHWDHGWAHCR